MGSDTFKEDFDQYLEHLKTADNSIYQKPSLVIIVLDAATIQNTINAKATEMKQRIELILRHKLDLLFIFNKIDTISCSTKKYETADYRFYGARKLFSDHFGIPMNRIFPLMTYCSIPRKNFDHDIHIAKIVIKISKRLSHFKTKKETTSPLNWIPAQKILPAIVSGILLCAFLLYGLDPDVFSKNLTAFGYSFLYLF